MKKAVTRIHRRSLSNLIHHRHQDTLSTDKDHQFSRRHQELPPLEELVLHTQELSLHEQLFDPELTQSWRANPLSVGLKRRLISIATIGQNPSKNITGTTHETTSHLLVQDQKEPIVKDSIELLSLLDELGLDESLDKLSLHRYPLARRYITKDVIPSDRELVVEGINYLFDTLPPLQQLPPVVSSTCLSIPLDVPEDTDYIVVTKKVHHHPTDQDISHPTAKRQKISHHH